MVRFIVARNGVLPPFLIRKAKTDLCDMSVLFSFGRSSDDLDIRINHFEFEGSLLKGNFNEKNPL